MASATHVDTGPAAALQYRTFDGNDDVVRSTFGTLASQSSAVVTVAICLRLISSNGFDGGLVRHQTDNPFMFFWWDTDSSKRAALWQPSGGFFVNDGPVLSPSHDCVVLVMTKDTTSPVEWSYYRFDTPGWAHSTSSVTVSSAPSWPSTESHDHFVNIGRSLNADIVCAAQWAGTKLTTTQRATMTNLAAWEALSPSELWRMDTTNPADSIVGTADTTIWSPSNLGALNGDSPFLES